MACLCLNSPPHTSLIIIMASCSQSISIISNTSSFAEICNKKDRAVYHLTLSYNLDIKIDYFISDDNFIN